MHKTNCMQSIEHITTWEVFSSIICPKGQFPVNPMRTIPTSGNRKSCLGPGFWTIYEFPSIQFLDTLLSDGYFHIISTKDSN